MLVVVLADPFLSICCSMWTMPESKDAVAASGREKAEINLIAGDCDPVKVSGGLALIGPRKELINSFRCYSVN